MRTGGSKSAERNMNIPLCKQLGCACCFKSHLSHMLTQTTLQLTMYLGSCKQVGQWREGGLVLDVAV